jgi:uncharacterized Zn finger protein (UPF0148 family)
MKKCNKCGERERAKGQTYCLDCKRESNRLSQVKRQAPQTTNNEFEELRQKVEQICSQLATVQEKIKELQSSVDYLSDIDFEHEVKRVLDDLHNRAF